MPNEKMESLRSLFTLCTLIPGMGSSQSLEQGEWLRTSKWEDGTSEVTVCTLCTLLPGMSPVENMPSKDNGHCVHCVHCYLKWILLKALMLFLLKSSRSKYWGHCVHCAHCYLEWILLQALDAVPDEEQPVQGLELLDHGCREVRDKVRGQIQQLQPGVEGRGEIYYLNFIFGQNLNLHLFTSY